MLFLRECVGEDGVGGGGPGISLSRGVEGREGVVVSSESEDEAASSQLSATGALTALVFVFFDGEIERFFRDESRPEARLEKFWRGVLGRAYRRFFGFW